jgi:four helix bundle protein
VSIAHFRELQVWRLAMELAKAVYQPTSGFAREQRCGLAAHWQRAAVSIPSNIAEGNARASTRDCARFVSMALGSTAELQTQRLLSGELAIGGDEPRRAALEISDRVGQMLLRPRQSLLRKREPASRVPRPESW